SRSLDRPARLSTRPTVLLETPIAWAMRAWVSRRRRSSTIARALDELMALGLSFGHEERSDRAPSPCARNRPNHFLAVGGLTPASAAASAGVSPRSAMSLTISIRRANVSRAFL